MSSERCGSMSIRWASPSTSTIGGNGLTDFPVVSLRNVCLVVTDLAASRSRLLELGIEVGESRHKTPIGAWGGSFAPGHKTSIVPATAPTRSSWSCSTSARAWFSRKTRTQAGLRSSRHAEGIPEHRNKRGSPERRPCQSRPMAVPQVCNRPSR